jgi:hypothetical protein
LPSANINIPQQSAASIEEFYMPTVGLVLLGVAVVALVIAWSKHRKDLSASATPTITPGTGPAVARDDSADKR